MTGMDLHFHGGPAWGGEVIGVEVVDGKKVPIEMKCKEVLYKNSCALVSFARMDQLKYVLSVARLVVFDNGAFKDWNDRRKGKKTNTTKEQWEKYYIKVRSIYSQIYWFLIPDVIEGTEEENDELVDNLPADLRNKAVPVWHSDESLERLDRLCKRWPTVAIGMCGPHRKIEKKESKERIQEIFYHIYCVRKFDVRIHGLRVLDGRVLGMFPYASGDSSFVATNVPKTDTQMTDVQCKLARTAIWKNKIETVIPPTVDAWVKLQQGCQS